MHGAKPNKSSQANIPATASGGLDNNLPLLVVNRSGESANEDKLYTRLDWITRGLIVAPIIMISIALGGIWGLYRQPFPLEKVMEFLELAPGGGSRNPIAVPVNYKLRRDITTPVSSPQKLGASTIMALGRLLPVGEVISITVPSGVPNARISSLNVTEGSRVKREQILAILDSKPRLQAVRDSAKATIAVREAALAQTRASIHASLVGSKAAVEQAEASSYREKLAFQRSKKLYNKKIIEKAAFDQTEASYLEAQKEVERMQATLSRFTSKSPDDQLDIIVAHRELQAAKAEYRRTKEELEQAYVRAPMDGTVLEIHARAGERPGATGVLDLGNIDQMIAKLEVYETQVRYISVGDSVSIMTGALPKKLAGNVLLIGLQIKKQSVISADPAANTDARVVEVIVQLDKASSAIASHFTNLQVEARIIWSSSR
jgi:HlyD family secretion protein